MLMILTINFFLTSNNLFSIYKIKPHKLYILNLELSIIITYIVCMI